MPSPRPISATCQNPSCEYYQKEEGKRIIRKGKNRSGRQEYLCLWCRSRFSERTNTPLCGTRLPNDELNKICKSALDGNGIRSIERATGHRRETVGRVLAAFAQDPGFSAKYLLGSKKFTALEIHEFSRIFSGLRNNRHKPERIPKKYTEENE